MKSAIISHLLFVFHRRRKMTQFWVKKTQINQVFEKHFPFLKIMNQRGKESEKQGDKLMNQRSSFSSKNSLTDKTTTLFSRETRRGSELLVLVVFSDYFHLIYKRTNGKRFSDQIQRDYRMHFSRRVASFHHIGEKKSSNAR